MPRTVRRVKERKSSIPSRDQLAVVASFLGGVILLGSVFLPWIASGSQTLMLGIQMAPLGVLTLVLAVGVMIASGLELPPWPGVLGGGALATGPLGVLVSIGSSRGECAFVCPSVGSGWYLALIGSGIPVLVQILQFLHAGESREQTRK